METAIISQTEEKSQGDLSNHSLKEENSLNNLENNIKAEYNKTEIIS